ncbi:probable disease resistance protein At5g66900 [Cornus florida]|uniref:probable disease resistance protein At5g66900 n=1 Tax=Cornus florida TaxID=4283 RepID=UPI00289A8C6A|nr:probable disease resistance protein At5g66900 [Cornus florida]
MAELIGGAALGSAFSKVLDAVVYVIGKGITFKSNLNEIQSILNSLKPIVSEIEKLDRELNHPEEETKRLILGLQEGEKLILECLKIKGLKIFTKPYYSKKLIEFEDWLVKIFQTDVQAIQTRDGKKILAKVDEINKKVDEINSKVDGLGLMMTTTTTSSIFERPCEVPGISGCIVGFDVHLRDLKTKLLEDGVQVVVLSAAGGCGKTTLVKMLCSDFEIRVFTARDKVVDRLPKALVQNCRFGINIFFVTVSKTPNLKLIVENMFRHASFTVPEFQNEDDAINQLGTMLRGLDPAVLLVLDDVWDESESLIQRFMFGITGYKILVASRSEFPKFDSTYKLGILRDPHDMELFCQSAFPQGGSMNIPEDLVREIHLTEDQEGEPSGTCLHICISYIHLIEDQEVELIVRGCGGFPLALYVVGGSLHGQPEVIWTRRRMQLSNESYERQSIFDLNSELLFRLKSSIDALDEKTHVKECFLDLGSFPENQRIRVAALMDMWTELYNLDEDGIYALGNIHELSSRNLVNVELTRYFTFLFFFEVTTTATITTTTTTTTCAYC